MGNDGFNRSPEFGIMVFSFVAIALGVSGLILPQMISPELTGFDALAAALSVWMWTMAGMTLVSIPLAAFTWSRRKEIRAAFKIFGCLPAGILSLVIVGLTAALFILRA